MILSVYKQNNTQSSSLCRFPMMLAEEDCAALLSCSPTMLHTIDKFSELFLPPLTPLHLLIPFPQGLPVLPNMPVSTHLAVVRAQEWERAIFLAVTVAQAKRQEEGTAMCSKYGHRQHMREEGEGTETQMMWQLKAQPPVTSKSLTNISLLGNRTRTQTHRHSTLL